MSALRQIVDMVGGLLLLAISFGVGLAVAFGTANVLQRCGASRHTSATFGGLLLIQVPWPTWRLIWRCWNAWTRPNEHCRQRHVADSGCTCDYPVQASFALIPVPST